MGLVFFLFVIVTEDLTLQMASSRPLVPLEAHSLATAQLMGRSSPSSISEWAGAPRHSTTHFFLRRPPPLRVGKALIDNPLANARVCPAWTVPHFRRRR